MTTRHSPEHSDPGHSAAWDDARPRDPSVSARAAVLAAATLTIMAAAIIAPSLPAMREVFADAPGGDVTVRMVLTVTSLAIALSAPLSGMAIDRVGARPLLLSGLTLYAVSGTAGVFLDDLYPLLVSRVLLGAAVGAIMTAVSAVIVGWYDGPRRASFLGLQQAFASLGGIVFLPLAGLAAELDWQAPFWIYATAAIVLLAALPTVRDRPRGEPRSVAPGRPARRSRSGRRVAGVYASALAATLVFYMGPTQLPFLLDGFGANPVAVGAVIAASTVSGVGAAVAFPAVRRRLDATVITAASLALLGAGWMLIGTATGIGQVVVGLLIGGGGVGLYVPNANLRLSELASPRLRGRVLSGLVTAIFLGQFLSPLAAAPLIDSVDIPGAFSVTGAVMAAGAAVALVRGRSATNAGSPALDPSPREKGTDR